MITAKNLSFRYHGRTNLYQDFSLRIERGHIVGLLGTNGTGKSTLLKLICGVLSPDSGTLQVAGIDTHQLALPTLRSIAVVPEELELPNIPIESFVRHTAPFYPNFDHAFFADALSRFGIAPSERLGALSMGQRKKSYIAFAMACGTSLLLLDEPTNGLDIPSKTTLRRLLAEWATPERTVIISTHQVKDVENLIDHIVIIDHKGLVVDASTEHIAERLHFGVAPTAEGAIYSQSALGGVAVVKANDSHAESNIDIELLFNAATAEREAIRTILNPSTK